MLGGEEDSDEALQLAAAPCAPLKAHVCCRAVLEGLRIHAT